MSINFQTIDKNKDKNNLLRSSKVTQEKLHLNCILTSLVMELNILELKQINIGHNKLLPPPKNIV